MESSPESFESEEDISISHSKSPFYKTLQTPCGVVEVYDLEPCVRGDVVFLFTPGFFNYGFLFFCLIKNFKAIFLFFSIY